jgi:hypothetical protein
MTVSQLLKPYLSLSKLVLVLTNALNALELSLVNAINAAELTFWRPTLVDLLAQLENMDLMEFVKIVTLIVANVQDQAQRTVRNATQITFSKEALALIVAETECLDTKRSALAAQLDAKFAQENCLTNVTFAFQTTIQQALELELKLFVLATNMLELEDATIEMLHVVDVLVVLMLNALIALKDTC